MSRIVLAAVVLAWAATARASQPDVQDLKALTIEELMQIDVTLAARRPEPAGTAAAALSVVTAEDIRRSGVTTLADAVGLAGAVHVARVNNSSWAISSRGFNTTSANKLLVMVDGRTVYSSLFTGVFWNTLDYILEDVERIEIIRGPGATLWGANAVNGVINIVTRHAADTRGTLLSVASGAEQPALLEARYGSGASGLHWRAYGKYARRASQTFSTGESARDRANRGQAGFRVDGGERNGNAWMVSGDVFHSWFGFADRPDGEFTDVNVQGLWARGLTPAAHLSIQSYYRREYRRVPRQLTHRIDVGDVHVEVNAARGRHQLVTGGGVRISHDSTHGTPAISFEPASRTYPLVSAFVQDEVALRPEQLFLTAGVKVEHNVFSGADWQPSVRARWILPRRQMVWSAVSRAMRRATRLEDDVVVADAATARPLIIGSDDFASEKLTSWELGYRARPTAAISLDATLFVHDYDDLRSQEAPLAPGLPVVLGNTLNGRSAGLELSANVQPAPGWRTYVSYTFLDTEITRDADSRDLGLGVSEANDPRHLFTLRTMVNLPRDVQVDWWVRGVGSLPAPRVPGYVEVSGRVGWNVSPRLELAVVGQDLLHARHPEFGPPGPQRIEFERSVRAQATVRLR